MHRREIFTEVLKVETAIAAVVFAVVLALTAYAVVRRRAAAGAEPSHRAEHVRPELFYLGGLAVVAAFLVAYTAQANHRDRPAEAAGHRPPLRVDVTAFQWCWSFSYPESGATVREAGSGSRPADCREGRRPTLVVPTGRTVRFEMTSKDVIHSLWVPALRYKRDVFPHHRNSFTVRIDEEGRWIARCAEFCGERHHSMDFWLKAVSPAEFADWQQAQNAAAGEGAAA